MKKLELYLQNLDLVAADEETARIMLSYTKNDYLDEKELPLIPIDIIKSIDRLWYDKTKGRFGFKIQFEVWSSLNNSCPISEQPSSFFIKNLGLPYWRSNSQPTYNVSAPKGYFPLCWMWGFKSWDMENDQVLDVSLIQELGRLLNNSGASKEPQKQRTVQKWWEFWKTDETFGKSDNSSNNSVLHESRFSNISDKTKICLGCGASIKDGELKCKECGSSKFIWE